MNEAILTTLSQFGAAGLIGILWIMERRFAQARERQITDAHERIMKRDEHLDVLLRVVNDNTKALQSLDQSHRRLADLFDDRAPRSATRSTSGHASHGGR